nr:MAG TPA: hypothetical protein [Caudoviricetes sp.]
MAFSTFFAVPVLSLNSKGFLTDSKWSDVKLLT